MLNLAILQGTLTDPPTKATTKNGKPVVELKLMNETTSGTFTRKCFMTVTCYGRAADAAQGLSRDQSITVQGQITSWKGKDDKWHVGIQAQEIHGAPMKPSWDAVDQDAPF